MICLNATTDSNDSAISYSLPSSPVRSSAIQQLLESPIIKPNSQKTETENSEKNVESDTDRDNTFEDIIVTESPETTPLGSQETEQQLSADLPLEVANSQTVVEQTDINMNEPNSRNYCRNSFRRQTSVCASNGSPFNSSIASSPRALAILKNAIKTSFNSTKTSDKLAEISEENTVVLKNSKNMIDSNGVNSPPNNKLFRNSPLSRGSALLKAAKERMERQEVERSPKFNYNQVLNESNYDRRLTGILRKHELTSSPTSGEPKAKKKKVLFAEPVVSSKLEFKTLSTLSCFEPLDGLLPQNSADIEVEETIKQNRILVHQNSTFDKEFDSESSQSDSPLLFTDESEDTFIPSCGQPKDSTDCTVDNEGVSSPTIEPLNTNLLERKHLDSLEEDQEMVKVLGSQSSQSSEDLFICSQIMPENSYDVVESLTTPENSQNASVQTEDSDNDPIVMVPIRLSQIRDLYHLFGGLIQKYSKS